MADSVPAQQNILIDCWMSFRALPAWVQVWVAFFLVPLNFASVLFIAEPMGIWVAILANIAMLLNLPVMFHDRGFSKLMAVPHLVPWTILIFMILLARPAATGAYDVYLSALMLGNITSLMFDYPDAIDWFKGNRTVAGRQVQRCVEEVEEIEKIE